MPSDFREYRPETLAPFDLPESPEWSDDKMLIRHAVAISGKLNAAVIASATNKLDSFATEFGLARHGSLTYESWNWGRQQGIASMFRIVDIRKFVERTEDDARHNERDRIRRLSWWRRLLVPMLKDKDVS